MKHQSATTSALFVLIIGLFFLTFNQSTMAQSALDGFDPNANGAVRAVVVQPDGKILFGGDFTTIGGFTRNRIARFNPDGTLDTAFDPNADGTVYAIAIQSDGMIVAGGFFTNIGGQPRNRIARLDATTGAPDLFDPNANNEVRSLAIQSNGMIVAGGLFSTIGGQSRSRIARLDATTGLADLFAPNADNSVRSIAIQSDGKIVAGGSFTNIGGQPRPFIARLDATTGAADSFNPNATSFVLSIAIQSDGKILAGGSFTTIGGQTRNYIARLDATTGAADSFNPNANINVFSIAIQSDGKILAGGLFTTIGGQTRNFIARLDATTGLADSFAPNASSTVNAIAIQSDGKILAGGTFTTVAPNGGAAVTRNRIARFERDGLLDRTLNLSAVGNLVLATAIQPDGKIIISGFFSSVLGTARNNIARLNPDGTLDTAFNPNANNQVNSIAVQSDGKILLGGFFTTLSPNGGAAVTHNSIARVNADGTLDTAFDPNANNGVLSIAVQSDGKILLGGTFSTLSPNGGAAVFRFRIARLNADGTLDTAFDPNANSNVLSIAVQSDGKILLGGIFGTLSPNGGAAVTRNSIARLNANGTLDTGFDPNANDGVLSIAVQSDGKILLGGQFSTLSPNGGAAVTRLRIARVNADGTLDTAFDPNANSDVYSIAVQSDGKILLGGNFNTIGGVSRNLFARLSNDTAALSNLAVTQTTLTLTRDGSAAQFARVIFEQSIDNGANYTLLGTATNSLTSPVNGKGENPFAPTAAGYTLGGQNIPTGQNVLIRARGFYRTGYQSGSETTEDKVQIAYFLAPTAANVSVGGKVQTASGRAIPRAIVSMTDSSGQIRTARSNPFGYFRFDDVSVGENYVFDIRAKGYSFVPQVLNINEDIRDLNFTAQ